MSGLDELMELSHPRLSDRIDVACRAAELLLGLTKRRWEVDGLEAVTALRIRRSDSPLILSVTEAALDPDPDRSAQGLNAALAKLKDSSWLVDTALGMSHAGSFGILSLGETTIDILRTYLDVTGTEPELYVEKRSVARGLGNLGLPIFVGNPAPADVLLVPAHARHNRRIWTTPSIVKTVEGAAREIRTTEHPMAHLSPLNRLTYRPVIELIDYELT